MSNAAQALEHMVLSDTTERAKFWGEKAVQFLPRELTFPTHVRLQAADRTILIQCTICGKHAHLASVASLADFRDWHWCCRQELCRAWSCSKCGAHEFIWLVSCRFCGTASTLTMPSEYLPPHEVLNQRQEYTVWNEDHIVAIVQCGSLLRARRAARAMFPQERRVTVRSKAGCWLAYS